MFDSALLAAVQDRPDVETRWLALAGWLGDNGRDDEAAAIRVFWAVIRDSMEDRRTPESPLDLIRRNAKRLGRRARGIEERGATG